MAQIDTSLEHMQELLAGCTNKAANGIMACIKARFHDPDNEQQRMEIETLEQALLKSQQQRRLRRRQARLKAEARLALLKEATAAVESCGEAEAEARRSEAPAPPAEVRLIEAPAADESCGEAEAERRGSARCDSAEQSASPRLGFGGEAAAERRGSARCDLAERNASPLHQPIRFITEQMMQFIMQQCHLSAMVDLLNAYIQTIVTTEIPAYDYEYNRRPLLSLLDMALSANIIRHHCSRPDTPCLGWKFNPIYTPRLTKRDPATIAYQKRLGIFY